VSWITKQQAGVIVDDRELDVAVTFAAAVLFEYGLVVAVKRSVHLLPLKIDDCYTSREVWDNRPHLDTPNESG
jgi:hypothetical protein